MTIHLSSLIKRAVITGLLISAFALGLMVPQPAQAETSSAQYNQQLIAQLMEMVQQLMKQLAALQEPEAHSIRTTPIVGIGTQIITTDSLTVRSGPSTANSWVNTIAKGVQGQIVEGPKYQGGYTWWGVQYANGTRGWSAGNWLEAYGYEVDTTEHNRLLSNKEQPTCRITTDKNSYVYGEDIEIRWYTDNADYVRFTDFSSKDTLDLPSRKLDEDGSVDVEAEVTGRPTIKLTAYNDDGTSSTCSRAISIEGPSVELRVNYQSDSTYTATADETISFTYHPQGDINTCETVAYYEEGEIAYEHAWNKWVDANKSDNYGRYGFAAVDSYQPYNVYGALEKVRVSCDVDQGSDVSDSMRIKVADSGERREYVIEYNDDEMSSGSNASEAEVWLACRDAVDSIQYGSPAPQSGDQVDCYWGNERIFTIDGWKG